MQQLPPPPQDAGMVDYSMEAPEELHLLVCSLGSGLNHMACTGQWDHGNYNARGSLLSFYTLGLTPLEYSLLEPSHHAVRMVIQAIIHMERS